MSDRTFGSDMAFPCEGPNTRAFGLTKREWMATMVLSGLVGNSNGGGNSCCPKFALELTDMLLSALNPADTRDEHGL